MLADSVVFSSVATGGNCQEKYSVFHYLKNWKGGEIVLKRLIPWGGLRHPPGCSVFSVWVTVTLSFFIVFSVLFWYFRYFPLSVTG